LVRRFEERLDFLNLMFIELVEFEARHLDELFHLIFPQLMAFGQRLQRFQVELRPIPTPILLRTFIGFFFSYVITEYLIGKHLPPEMRQARSTIPSIFFYTASLKGILMNSRLISIIRKEFIQIRRDPRTLILVLVIPVMQLFLLGYAATNDVRNVPLAVYDQDRSPAARRLLDAYRAPDYFSLAFDVLAQQMSCAS
jgi:hypothetical protein